MTYDEAQAECAMQDGQLASIRSAEENAEAMALFATRDYDLYWLGATEREEIGTWKWDDEVSEFAAWTSWADNQPRDDYGAAQSCLVVHYLTDDDGQGQTGWYDQECSEWRWNQKRPLCRSNAPVANVNTPNHEQSIASWDCRNSMNPENKNTCWGDTAFQQCAGN